MPTSRSKPTAYQIGTYAFGLLLFGSINTITMKGEFSLRSKGLDGTPKQFSKPWFANMNVFFACLMVLVYDTCSRCLSRRKSKLSKSLLSAPDMESAGDKNPAETEQPYWVKVCLVSIPATIDVAATGLGCLGMMFVPASVWQMIRGSMIIFTAMFSILFLNRKMLCYNWFGVCLCILGVIVVGFASVAEAGSTEGAGGGDQYLLGIAMLLLGQVFQAAQMVLEEWLLKKVQLESLQVIGWEGAWGFLIILIGYPVLYAMPGADNGHLEDPFDTEAMLANSGALFLMVMTYTFSCATYNVAGITVTEYLSSMHRVLIEASRTVVVWGFGLFIHCIDANSPFGEAWTPYSYVRLGGFLVLTIGQATYGGLLKWPCCFYPPEARTSTHRSPSAAVNMITPLPDKDQSLITLE